MQRDQRHQAHTDDREAAEQAERIRADADRERTVILANAYRDAQRIRGDGDAQAAAIFAKAYGKDPEFYSFHRSLEAYRRSLGTGQDVLVLEPKVFGDARGFFIESLSVPH